jgi:hypothetical protein
MLPRPPITSTRRPPRAARALDDVALLAEVAGRQAGVALRLADLDRDRLALRDQGEDLAIDLSEGRAQLVEGRHARMVS